MARGNSQKINSIYKTPDFWYHQIMFFLFFLITFSPLNSPQRYLASKIPVTHATIPIKTAAWQHLLYGLSPEHTRLASR